MGWAVPCCHQGGPSLLHQGVRRAHPAAGRRLSPSACVLSPSGPLFHTPAHPLLGCSPPADQASREFRGPVTSVL